MSNRFIRILCALAVIVVVLSCLMVTTCSSPTWTPTRTTSSFRTVSDRPIIESLDKYYELVQKGRTTITVDGLEHTIFWQDFSQEEKQIIQLRLRTP